MGQEQNILELPIWKVEPNRKQPRQYFDEDALGELAESIKKYGIIEPVVVKKESDYYSIIAGERRWRAARKAGLQKIPVVLKDLSKQEAADIALIENVQREDLNPIEEARAYKSYCEEYGVTQEILAEKISKKRAAVANVMRLLNLPNEIQDMIASGKLSYSHGRSLLVFKDKSEQLKVANYMVAHDVSAREAEKMAREKKKKTKKPLKYDDVYISEKLTEATGMKVNISRSSKKNVMSIDFYSEDELNKLYDCLMQMQYC